MNKNWSNNENKNSVWYTLENDIKDILKWNLSQEEIDRLWTKFRGSYYPVKDLLDWQIRNTWEPYFEHIIRCLKILFYEFQELVIPEHASIIIQLIILHDLVENTNIDIASVKRFKWYEVGEMLDDLTKNNWTTYIENKDHKETVNLAFNSYMLDEKYDITPEYKNKKKNNDLTDDEQQLLNNYDDLKNIYKKIRNNQYHQNLLNIVNKYKKTDVDSSVKIKIYITILVKAIDRLDNLRTTELYTTWNDDNLEKALRKIEETKLHYNILFLSVEPELYNEIIIEIERLETYIELHNIQEFTEDNILKVFPHSNK